MSIDVMDGTLRGVDALLESWRLFSVYHADVQLQLQRLETSPRGSVVATAKTAITITENTLRNLYPHLLVDAFGNNEWSPLAHRLLNQHIEMESTICFDWDHSSGRVVYVETKRDILTPMLHLLGSLANVSYVFDGARITLEGTRIQEPSS
ncbi:hypothetical protein PHMEG_0001612 [Phytophthora megakarya]|uniref:Bzip transcription factor n=1 Tax=Phytophthora megakarya TaxID=4795 RepID=A0A225X1C0_9STRA|nr:hypothetical protein PHMEG_0001612 [Phytophthora megakarya]